MPTDDPCRNETLPALFLVKQGLQHRLMIHSRDKQPDQCILRKQADLAGIHTERIHNIPFYAILSIVRFEVGQRREHVVIGSRA